MLLPENLVFSVGASFLAIHAMRNLFSRNETSFAHETAMAGSVFMRLPFASWLPLSSRGAFLFDPRSGEARLAIDTHTRSSSWVSGWSNCNNWRASTAIP